MKGINEVQNAITRYQLAKSKQRSLRIEANKLASRLEEIATTLRQRPEAAVIDTRLAYSVKALAQAATETEKECADTRLKLREISDWMPLIGEAIVDVE